MSKSINIGVSGNYDKFISLRLRVDAANHGNLSKWADIYLRKIIFDPKRIASVAKKLVSYAEPDGDDMAHLLSFYHIYTQGQTQELHSYIKFKKI